jgi:hypothetical protein
LRWASSSRASSSRQTRHTGSGSSTRSCRSRNSCRRRAVGAEILECSPLSVRLTKEAVFDGLLYSVDEALERDPSRRERLLASEDYVEGRRRSRRSGSRSGPAGSRGPRTPSPGASGRSSRRGASRSSARRTLGLVERGVRELRDSASTAPCTS